jgi:hypothetical protein
MRAQVFINASTSDVVATTSMEALAMGKWLICARHACNVFVSQFRTCLVYESPAEFSGHLLHALREEPPRLSPEELRCRPSPPSQGCPPASAELPLLLPPACLCLQKGSLAGMSMEELWG